MRSPDLPCVHRFPADMDAHLYTTCGPRFYVRGPCAVCRHTPLPDPAEGRPSRIVEYYERDPAGQPVAWVNEVHPCPWTGCPLALPLDRPSDRP